MKKILFALVIVVVGFGFFGGTLAHAAVPTVVSGKITGPNTVTLVFSEPVNTNITSYYGFTGVLSGHNLIGLSGGGSNTIVLNFDGAPFVGGTGGLTVSGGTTSISDNSQFAGGGISVLSGQVPTVMSFSVFSNNPATALGKVGDVLTLNFTLNEPVNNPTVTIANHSAYPNGSGMGPYVATYTVAPSDVTGAPLSATISFTDFTGNTGNTTITFSNGGGSGATLPIITSVYSNARAGGALKVGDSIMFTINALTAVPNGRVNASYNGVPLNWTTSNNGLTYTATYTVAAGNLNQPTPLQLSGVTLTDNTTGATSAPASGYDVAKTISANPPSIYESIPVPSATGNQNPIYTFSSNVAGAITYGGECVSPTVNAVSGANTITFINLSVGLHNSCTITLTDVAGNVSAPLRVSPFTILGGSSTTSTPTITQTTITTPTTSAAPSNNTTTQLQALQAMLAQLQTQAAASQNSGASSASSYKFSTLLKFGSNGTAVTELQKRLIAAGFLKTAANGNFGPSTESALRKYQSAHGLKAVGELGPATRVLLNNQ